MSYVSDDIRHMTLKTYAYMGVYGPPECGSNKEGVQDIQIFLYNSRMSKIYRICFTISEVEFYNPIS